MKGLLLKDLYNMRIYGKTLCMLIVFMGIFGVMLKNPTYICSMIIFMTISLAITAISQDEQARWDQYALTLPVSRKMLVKEKMLLAYAFVLAGGILAALIGGVMEYLLGGNLAFLMKAVGVAVVYVALVISILLPAVFKFGAEKGRYIMMACIAGPIIILVLTLQHLENSGIEITKLSLNDILGTVIILGVLAAAIAVFISYKISVKVYNAKEW